MANAQKYTRAACGHLAAHYERKKDEKGKYVKFGNQDIDPQKTHLNYNLAPRRGVEQIDFIRQRTGVHRRELHNIVSAVLRLCPNRKTGVAGAGLSPVCGTHQQVHKVACMGDGASEPEMKKGGAVSPAFFGVLGAKPLTSGGK